jgi:putative tryptophan/tyrosine transport system substrate-binding protein
MMRRREFVGLIGGAAAGWPLASRAQQRQDMRTLGVLMVGAEADADSVPRIDGFRQGLQDLGWKDGENIHIEYRWGAGRPELIRQYAQELVALKPDVILANGTPAVATLKSLTRSIPIVCALVIDPVGLGLVDSLSRPGGNITGFSFINVELIGKWTALLKEAAPSVMRAALLYNPKVNPWYVNFQRELAVSPQSVALPLVSSPVETTDELQSTIEGLALTPDTGLIIGPDAFVVVHIQKVAQLAAANRLPGISVYRQFAVEGGLMTYGPDVPDIFRRSAGYVDRILKGANPAELPVQQPTKFEFVVNQKAARSLGVSLSATLLAGADDVIE